MDFSDLQQSWQAQAAPVAVPGPPQAGKAASLLAETERLHRFGRRQNWLGTALVALALVSLLGPTLFGQQPLAPLQWGGFSLLLLTMGSYVAAIWRGTTLRQTAQPGLDSRAYVQASLRVFRFRRTQLLRLSLPYVLGLGGGLLLLQFPHFQANGHLSWGRLGLWVALLLLLALAGRYAGLRRYEREFGPTERALARWQQTLLAES